MKKRVLIVDDVRVTREFLAYLVNATPDLTVSGLATNGQEALEAIARERPDVVIMDINMPVLDGLQTTRLVMEHTPVPIVIVSAGTNLQDTTASFRALEAGAVIVMTKPGGIGHPLHERESRELIQKVRAVTGVKLVRRIRKAPPADPVSGLKIPIPTNIGTSRPEIVAIGASTGGPQALKELLSGLPAQFALPVVIVQHIEPGFLRGLLNWLQPFTVLPLQLALEGEKPQPGQVYFAPGEINLEINARRHFTLTKSEPHHGIRPSVSHLFHSVEAVYGGASLAILLSGMGRDGAAELKRLHERGAVTMAQDAASSVVHGMPGEAIRLGGAGYIDTPSSLAALLLQIATPIRRNYGT